MGTFGDRFLGFFSRGRCRTKHRPRRWVGYRPWVEILESRTVPSTAFVHSVADSGTGSLRAALAAPGVTTIDFNFSTGGVHTIQLLSALEITSTVLIDGYSQAGATMNTSTTGDNATILIRIDGSKAGAGAHGLDVLANNCVIRGLDFTGFLATSSTSPSGGIAVNVTGSGNLIAGDFIGIAPNGTTPVGNTTGVAISGSSNTVGATSMSNMGDCNLISGNFQEGVDITGTSAVGNLVSGNLVSGNLIGPDRSGSTALATGISGDGILLENGAQNNQIGIGAAAALPNTIAYNGAAGVVVGFPNILTDPNDDLTTGNSIRQNSIHDNVGLGIDLNSSLQEVVAAGHAPPSTTGDGITINNYRDTFLPGPNNFQNYPIILTTAPGSTTAISGTLNSRPGNTFNLDFYVSNGPSLLLYGAGLQYLGSTSVTTDSSGDSSFSVNLPTATGAGQWVAATATDSAGNTSEFSEAHQLPAATPVLNATSWTALGPTALANGRGPGGQPSIGRVTSLAADPTNANHIYVGTGDGGVWETFDGGHTWTPLTDNQANLSIGAIALAPSNPSIIYAGTGEADDLESLYGRGVLKSTDAGQTWTLLTGNAGVNEFNLQHISQIVIDPTNPNNVFVAVEGPEGASAPPAFAGIWKSTDGGTTWTQTTAAITKTAEYTDLAMDVTNPNILFAAVGSVPGSPYNGVYKTTDGGTTWRRSGNYPMGTANGKIKVALSRTNDQVLYSAISQPSIGGLLKMMKSSDGGKTWTQLANIPDYLDRQGFYDTTLAVDPSDPNTAYAGGSLDEGPPGIIELTAGGSSWTDLTNGTDGNGPHTNHHGIGFDANGKLLVGTDGGIWRLDNPTPGAIHWSDLNGNLAITMVNGTIALNPTDPTIVYAGSISNGIEEYQGDLQWTNVRSYGDGGSGVMDFNNPATLYWVQGNNARTILRTNDAGAIWVQTTNGINQSDLSNFYEPLVMDPTNSHRLLFGTDHLYQTTDQANNWSAIGSPGVNGFNPNDHVIDSIAIAPSAPNTIYVTAQGDIFVTINDGAQWTKIDIPGFTDHFAQIRVNPTNSLNAFIVRDRFSGAAGGHLFETTNGGASWIDASARLPNAPTNTILFDPRTAVLYVGDDIGVYASTNGGRTWVRFGTGLPNVQVVDLELNTNYNVLAVGTRGRGVFEIQVTVPATHLGVTPAAGVVGRTINVGVTGLAGFSVLVSNNGGTVQFTSIERQAGLLPDDTYTAASASSSLTQTVNKDSTTTMTVGLRLDPAQSGHAAPFTATVSSQIEDLTADWDVNSLFWKAFQNVTGVT